MKEKIDDITLINGDCMDYMRELPDNAFDLAVVDPPYGGAGQLGGEYCCFGGRFEKYGVGRTGGAWAEKYGNKIKSWDIAPGDEYFKELFRVSRNQVIFGGNYFRLPPTRCFLVWRKLSISEDFSMAMAEYAWTSFNGNAKVFECAPQGTKKEPRIHPCQKPIALYRWILRLFAHKGDKILDTHLGSGSSAIAAFDMGCEFVGIELDETYYNAAKERIESYVSLPKLAL